MFLISILGDYFLSLNYLRISAKDSYHETICEQSHNFLCA